MASGFVGRLKPAPTYGGPAFAGPLEYTPLTMSAFTRINPPELGVPRGFSHGVLAPEGSRVLFVAGQTAADAGGHGRTDR